MLYGQDMRGPLDVLRESWEADKRSNPDVVFYVLLMRDRLEKMREEVQSNLSAASSHQKVWYDRSARERTFQPGEEVLVLLPTTTSKLTAQWQAPYQVVGAVGKVNYRVHMQGWWKKTRIFHVNMLQKWNAPV